MRQSPILAHAPRPIVKWAGGKAQLLGPIRERLPRTIETYFEPFAGGAALLFALATEHGPRAPSRAVLSDVNAELITTYRVVRDEPDALCEALCALQATYLDGDAEEREATYYRVRAEQPADAVGCAARLLFLNKTCYNGLYRVNRSGQFNVPHGRYARPVILDERNLRAASRLLQEVELRHVDFEAAVEDARAGDFVYFDPPFEPLSPTSSFTAYTDDGFGRRDQVRLRSVIDRLTRRGVAVMLSNSPHPWILGLYRDAGYAGAGYAMEVVPARRAINSNPAGRGPIGELLLTNYTPPVPPQQPSLNGSVYAAGGSTPSERPASTI